MTVCARFERAVESQRSRLSRGEVVVLLEMPSSFQNQSRSPRRRRLAGQAVDKRQRGINLGRRQASRQQRRAVDGIEIVRRTKHGNSRKVPSLFVVAEEEKRLVLYYRPADSSAELMTHILRLQGHTGRHAVYKLVDKTIWITCTPFVVTGVPNPSRETRCCLI